MSRYCSVLGCSSNDGLRNITLHSIPDSFRDIWTREKKLQWKSVKKTLICNLHFEARCFKGKRLNLKVANPKCFEPNSNELPDHDYAVEQEENNTKSELERLKAQNEKLIRANELLLNDNKNLATKLERMRCANNYLKRKNKDLQDQSDEFLKKIKDLQSKYQLSTSISRHLENCASKVPKHLFQSTAKRAAGSRDATYHPSIRKFALSLHLCSPKAYRFVREEFENALPNERTLREWCFRIDCEPGFSRHSIEYLRRKAAADETVLVSLALDEMSLHQNLHFDGSSFVGGIDFGANSELCTDGHNGMAKEALCFMVVSVMDRWRIPFGYFFVAGLNGKERANITRRAIDEVAETGVKLVSVTCDSLKAQTSMMKILGARLEPNELDLQICKGKYQTPIHFIHDMCHMVKLIRNAWHFHRKFKDSEGGIVDWRYIEMLLEIQCKEQLKCANRLTISHIHFQNVKMKVKYAVQVLSRRTAKSLEFCREILKLESFRDSEPTQKFVQIFNDIFDVFNSNQKYSSNFYAMKNALSRDNEELWMGTMMKTEQYISGLQTMSGASLVKEDSRRTGFIGILANIKAVRAIFDEFVRNGPLEYLCTYKLSQDMLEHFFGLVRLQCGANNNPTAVQFKSIYKRILIGISQKLVSNSNITLLDPENLVAATPHLEERIDHVLDFYDINEFDIDDICLSGLSDFKKNVAHYIGGYVIKRVIPKLSCNQCIDSLQKSRKVPGLISTFDIDHYMIYPSTFVEKIAEMCEIIVSTELEKDFVMKRFFFDFVSMKVSTQFISLHSRFFKVLDNHSYTLLKTIIDCYISIRLRGHAHMKNDEMKRIRIRSKMSKLILFNHQ